MSVGVMVFFGPESKGLLSEPSFYIALGHFINSYRIP